jgi:glycosyltransferase involved in cell wall biosynthesis
MMNLRYGNGRAARRGDRQSRKSLATQNAAMSERSSGARLGRSRDWRIEARCRQRECLPMGPTVVSSTGPYGTGGLGRHLAELVEALRDVGHLYAYLTPGINAPDAGGVGTTVRIPRAARTVLNAPPVRFSLGWRVLLGNIAFDRVAARRLSADAHHLLVFNGHALCHAVAARRLGYRSIGLVSANCHLAYVARQHEKAWRQYPIERPWGPRVAARNLAEYDAVDYVYVSSRYAWDTFVAEGFPEGRLRLFPLTPDERYQPRRDAPTSSTFNVVYVGSLSVHKGVPLLIDAVRRLPYDDLRLILVGGWGTPGMRRHIEAATAADARIEVRPGDPVPQFHQAGVCAHPSYTDGFGYAPAEALACGVPVIVTDDTGMKDLVQPGVNGCVIPTGDLDALTLAIEDAYRIGCDASRAGEAYSGGSGVAS